mmetsp:Transcript_1795/g.7191  ORF Transcript_1795/g.7191 Transcript_1795/m.7191 type:complete len:328 (+) Transcript_1795:1611-2594(+)
MRRGRASPAAACASPAWRPQSLPRPGAWLRRRAAPHRGAALLPRPRGHPGARTARAAATPPRARTASTTGNTGSIPRQPRRRRPRRRLQRSAPPCHPQSWPRPCDRDTRTGPRAGARSAPCTPPGAWQCCSRRRGSNFAWSRAASGRGARASWPARRPGTSRRPAAGARAARAGHLLALVAMARARAPPLRALLRARRPRRASKRRGQHRRPRSRRHRSAHAAASPASSARPVARRPAGAVCRPACAAAAPRRRLWPPELAVVPATPSGSQAAPRRFPAPRPAARRLLHLRIRPPRPRRPCRCRCYIASRSIGRPPRRRPPPASRAA